MVVPISVVMAEDNYLVREGVRQLKDNRAAALVYACTIAERACEDLRALGGEVQ